MEEDKPMTKPQKIEGGKKMKIINSQRKEWIRQIVTLKYPEPIDGRTWNEEAGYWEFRDKDCVFKVSRNQAIEDVIKILGEEQN
jgi:hypothetical protein